MKPLKLSTSTLAAFAGPAAPISALGLPIAVYLPPFYAGNLGLGLALVGGIFMLTRFWDVVTDPVLGVLSDQFTTRWGRRRPWIVLATPILMFCAYRVFMPVPPVSGAYLLGWMILLYAGWTLLTISHMSWGAELSPDYHERSRIQAWREVALILGMITVLALPAVIERSGGASADRVAAMGWFIVFLLPLTVVLAVWKVPEGRVPPPAPIGWRRALAIIVGNRPLRRVLSMDLISGYAGGIVASLFLFVADSRLGLGRWASLLLLVYFASGCICVPIMVRVSYRWGKHHTLAASSIFSAVTLPLMFLIPNGNVLVAFALFALFGVNMGAGPFLFRSIMADVSDEDRVVSGAQRTGLYFSLLTMTNKVGNALAIGSIYLLLDWIGYVPGAENTPYAVEGLMYLYVFPPVLIGLLVGVALWNFPLDLKRQQELRTILDQRDTAAALAD
ncbi:MAG: MFS transporter [Candidatus Binatia bacterium]